MFRSAARGANSGSNKLVPYFGRMLLRQVNLGDDTFPRLTRRRGGGYVGLLGTMPSTAVGFSFTTVHLGVAVPRVALLDDTRNCVPPRR